jgi:hypothetical protein
MAAQAAARVGVRNWFYKFFRPPSGDNLNVGHTYWTPEPAKMGPGDFEKLWKEIVPRFPITRFPDATLFTSITAHTRGRQAQGRTFGDVESFVENEHLRGVLGEVEIDFVLALGDDPDDIRQVIRALHLSLSFRELPYLVLRGDEEWAEATAHDILRFFENRPSHSLGTRLSVAFAVAVLVAFGFFAFGISLGFPMLTIFVTAPSLAVGFSAGVAAWVGSERIFPVSRIYADSRTGEPRWWYTRAEILFWGIVTGVVAAWVYGILTGKLG